MSHSALVTKIEAKTKHELMMLFRRATYRDAVQLKCGMVAKKLLCLLWAGQLKHTLCSESGSPPWQCNCKSTSPRLVTLRSRRPEWKLSNVACVTWDVAASLILAEALTDTPVCPRLCCLLFISRNFLWGMKCILRVWRRRSAGNRRSGAMKSEWKWKSCLGIKRTDSWAPKGEVSQTQILKYLHMNVCDERGKCFKFCSDQNCFSQMMSVSLISHTNTPWEIIFLWRRIIWPKPSMNAHTSLSVYTRMHKSPLRLSL